MGQTENAFRILVQRDLVCGFQFCAGFSLDLQTGLPMNFYAALL